MQASAPRMTIVPERSLAAADHERRHRAGSAWTDRGTACLVSGWPGDRAESIRCQRKAIALLEALPIHENSGYLADLGTAWVNLACALQEDDTAESIPQALRALDRAIDLLDRLPLGESPRFRHNLAAAWMGRADAAVRMDTAACRRDALRDYGRAIALARTLPLEEKASFRVLLGSCWINLGNLHQRLSALSQAVAAYDEALSALGDLPSAPHRMACHHAATAWTNRGEALLGYFRGDGAGQAVDSARRALVLVERTGLDRPAAAKLSLRALRVMASGLESLMRGESARGDSVARLTDIAERGIDLAIGCRVAAPEVFDPFIAWFFSFGSRAYGRCQPQFLAEYLQEVLQRLDLDDAQPIAAELRTIARQATAGALEGLGRNRLLLEGTPQTELLLRTARELRGAAVLFSP
jgi:hypothetical protein